jgi:hypothetical protein
MTIVQLVLKFAAAVCSPDLHTNGTLPYWTICTIVFDAVTLVSMAFGALDKTKVKKFLCWFSFVPMLLVEGFATSGKVAWEGWNATEGPVERLVAPVGPKTNELLHFTPGSYATPHFTPATPNVNYPQPLPHNIPLKVEQLVAGNFYRAVMIFPEKVDEESPLNHDHLLVEDWGGGDKGCLRGLTLMLERG